MIIDFSNINGGGGGGGYVLPIASDTTLGGIKVGSGLTINSGGTLSADAQPVGIATTAQTGVVKIGSGVNIDSAGTISVDAIDPSTLKSVSALPLTAASGDVVVYDNMAWYYSPTTGSSVNITKSGKIIKAKYYNLPNGAKFPFPNEKVGQTAETGPWIEYDNGYFYLCWVQNGQVITAGTFSMNSRWVIFGNTLEGVHSGSQTYGEMVFNFNYYNFSLYTEGDWPNQSAGHWEPLDWSSDFKPSLPVATNVDCGMVRIGNGVNVDSAGTISVSGFVPTSAMSGYVQTNRLATTGQTGLVQIGSGITVDENGVISVTGGTGGGGIEVVTELPSSGTDGQMVLLETVIPEKHIKVDGTASSNLTTTVTAIGITAKTLLFKYYFYQEYVDVFVNTDNSITLESETSGTSINIAVGETDDFAFSSNGYNNSVNVAPSSTGCVLTTTGTCVKANVINTIDQRNEERQVLYTWSDAPLLTADIDYTVESGNYQNWCVRYKYSELPENKTLLISKYSHGNQYYHFVYTGGTLVMYSSDSATGYTESSATIVAQYGVTVAENYIYWTDDEIIFSKVKSFRVRYSFNIDDFYKIGWHKNVEHKVNGKAFHRDFEYYDGDYNFMFRNPEYPVNIQNVRMNNGSISVYTNGNSSIGPVYAPTTTGTTGYVCVAGSGNVAPTWAEPSTLTNGVKFWKGTQDQYDAMSGTGYDNSTLYIIIPEE